LRMVGMGEFVVLSELKADREKLSHFRGSHLSYMSRLKREGKLKMAGRFTDGSGGMYILVANSLEEANSLAKMDPYHANGLRTYVIREWQQRF